MQTTTQTITIKKIETKPEGDPTTNPTLPSRTVIRLDPEDRTVEVYQGYRTGSTPESVYHGRIIEWTATEHPKEEWMRNWLESNMTRLQTICDGHSVEWNGSNHVGKMTPEAKNAEDEIDFELDHDGLQSIDYYHLWTLEDWLESVEDDAIGKSDAELRELAEQCVMPGEEWQIIDSDADAAFVHLKKYRDENTE